jgi:hypothetical protein
MLWYDHVRWTLEMWEGERMEENERRLTDSIARHFRRSDRRMCEWLEIDFGSVADVRCDDKL